MNRLITLLATGFGVGFIPIAPGTWGSLWGVLAFFLFHTNKPIYAISLLGIFLGSVWVSGKAEKIWNQKDSQKIVLDEVVGQMTAYLFVAYTLPNLIIGFILFRLFDILKIFPANVAQDRLPGGWGVVVDDLVAGFQAGLILYVIQPLLVRFVLAA